MNLKWFEPPRDSYPNRFKSSFTDLGNSAPERQFGAVGLLLDVQKIAGPNPARPTNKNYSQKKAWQSAVSDGPHMFWKG